ncbi:MAG TPA: hypothetical protein VJM53_02785 [Burkholderiales bacterium]|nr:hypothetical protein [Burkholderiales bacterium]
MLEAFSRTRSVNGGKSNAVLRVAKLHARFSFRESHVNLQLLSRKILVTVGTLMPISLMPVIADAHTLYRTSQIGLLPDDFGSFGIDLNNAGIAVGDSSDDMGVSRAFRWSVSTGLQDLSATSGRDLKTGAAINNHGDITGRTSNRAYVLKPNGDYTEIPLPAGSSHTVTTALDINDKGQVVGNTINEFGETTSIIWDPINGTRHIGNASERSQAQAINNQGQVVGTIFRGNSQFDAYLWSDDQGLRIIDAPEDEQQVFFQNIDDTGRVMGTVFDDALGAPDQAFVWTETGGFELLGFLEGGNYSLATDTNSDGLVVGYGADTDSLNAFVWSEAEGMLDLNNLLSGNDPLKGKLHMIYATAINDAGQILVTGRLDNGNDQAFLLSPIPEPETYVFMLGGLVLLARKCLNREPRSSESPSRASLMHSE